jgi:osmoprotectant transport system ATP-binding protein
MSAMIEFEDVCKTYPNGVEAVRHLSLEISEGETLVLVGSSGCGKTTTMKMVNRLIEPTSGEIRIQGENVTTRDRVELRRTIGYAIQHVGLFPHMTIAENIAVVPKLRKWDKDRIAERVRKLLTLIGLEPDDFAERYPNQLSGGQRQRVGVARALAADPPIVLMDEPFGALDPLTREQLQDEFIELESEIQKTVLFVTHDIFEAVKMGNRVALLDQGRLQQLATPGELVESPANEFVDHFLGQHRFQLSLLTQTIASIVEAGEEGVEPPGEKEPRLNPRHSLVEALDLFKKTRKTTLPVVKREKVIGRLTKRHLLEIITKALEETGDES